VQVWKLEHPNVRFTTIVIGSTSGGEFFENADIPFPEDVDEFSLCAELGGVGLLVTTGPLRDHSLTEADRAFAAWLAATAPIAVEAGQGAHLLAALPGAMNCPLDLDRTLSVEV